MSTSFTLVKSDGNLFKDVGFNDIESKELYFRSSLMLKLNNYIQHQKLTQKAAATVLGVSQPRISNLISGRVDLFSAGMLLSMLERIGYNVYERIEDMLDAA